MDNQAQLSKWVSSYKLKKVLGGNRTMDCRLLRPIEEGVAIVNRFGNASEIRLCFGCMGHLYPGVTTYLKGVI